MKKEYLIVDKSILPDYFDSVLEAKKLVNDGANVKDACIKVNISRSTFYKYKDYIFYPSTSIGKKAIITFVVEHKKGILSNILNNIASKSGNILSINQETPIQDAAYITMVIDISEISLSLEELIKDLERIEGIKKVQLIAVE